MSVTAISKNVLKFQYDTGKLSAKDFWDAIINKDNSFALDAPLKREIESCQSNVNNPLSHAGVHNIHSRQVSRAIDKVKEFNAALALIR
ncbi:MAG: hypothetical protein WKF84_23900 [Pyrinomonadaceae bacterium]